MATIGPFNIVPTGAVYILQSTGVNGDIVLGPINFGQSGIATGLDKLTSGWSRFFLTMGS